MSNRRGAARPTNRLAPACTGRLSRRLHPGSSLQAWLARPCHKVTYPRVVIPRYFERVVRPRHTQCTNEGKPRDRSHPTSAISSRRAGIMRYSVLTAIRGNEYFLTVSSEERII